jgi:CRISPR-associated endonuclease/helicase Cas3
MSKNFQVRPFQEKVFECLMNGRSVILQAPTGSGKTKAALMPFLQNLAQGGNTLPHTCRYAVPLKVLANQFYREYDSIAARIDLQGHTHLVETYQSLNSNAISIQTGEQPDDLQMESALTFCTIDQLLASFLAVPYGVGSNRANLNVCKRYHNRGPLAIPKVSHFPQESAMLERKFEQSGRKERCIPWHCEMKFAPGS